MLAVSLPEAEVKALLDEKLSLAASNGPSLLRGFGAHDAVRCFQDKMPGIDCRRLHTSHAFHSPMMDRLLEPFTSQKVKLNPPRFPLSLTLQEPGLRQRRRQILATGQRHLRQTVQFTAGISQLLQEPNRILLEVGPGHLVPSLFSILSKRQAR